MTDDSPTSSSAVTRSMRCWAQCVALASLSVRHLTLLSSSEKRVWRQMHNLPAGQTIPPPESRASYVEGGHHPASGPGALLCILSLPLSSQPSCVCTAVCLGTFTHAENKSLKTRMTIGVQQNRLRIHLDCRDNDTWMRTCQTTLRSANLTSLMESAILCLLLEGRHETLRLRNHHGQTSSYIARTEHTAASSGGSAPFAMLCFPNLSRCMGRGGSLFVPSCGTSRASHSSRVAICPPRSEKNLCRSTVLIRSKPCVEYHPSRSCIDTTVRDVSKLCRGQAYVADLSEVLLIFDHLLQHRIADVAQLESSRLLRDSHAVEYM